MKSQEIKEKMKKAIVTKEMTLCNLGKNIFIGDPATTTHMISNKTGVYNLIPIKGSVMIGNGQSIICTHKGKLDVSCKRRDGSMAKETWDVKIVPQLNHDLFNFTKVMKVTGFYPSPKSSLSCTHVNSYQNYVLYINLHILLMIYQGVIKNPKIKEI